MFMSEEQQGCDEEDTNFMWIKYEVSIDDLQNKGQKPRWDWKAM